MIKFQQRIYNIVFKISKGKTMTYKEVAEKAPRSGKRGGNAEN